MLGEIIAYGYRDYAKRRVVNSQERNEFSRSPEPESPPTGFGRPWSPVEGTCAEPVFHPDLKGVVKGEVKSAGRTAGGLLKGLLGGRK